MVHLITGRGTIYNTYFPKKRKKHKYKSKKYRYIRKGLSPHAEHLYMSRRATKYVALAGFGKNRYCIINKAGNVVDDSGGHGFRSKKSAKKSGVWQKYKHFIVKEWCNDL